MKTASLIVCGLIGFAPFAVSQSAFDRELASLSEQREAALLKAIRPINDQYRKSLEQMLKKATQASDLDAAIRIKKELDGVKGELNNVPSSDKLISNPPKPSISDKLALKLKGTSWLWGKPPISKFTFLPNGEFEGHMKFARWSVIDDDAIFYKGDLNNDTIHGIMRVSKDLQRIDACEWSNAGVMMPIVVPRASK
jgi:hypothetical protein